jgi:hypothetical protein
MGKKVNFLLYINIVKRSIKRRNAFGYTPLSVSRRVPLDRSVNVPVSANFSHITVHSVFWKNLFYPGKVEPQKKKAFDRCRC